MSHVCSVSDCQSLDESGLNHSAIGGACEDDQGFIYKQLCGDIWAESREKLSSVFTTRSDTNQAVQQQ